MAKPKESKSKSEQSQLVKDILSGRYRKYDPDKHPALLLKVFKAGGDSRTFCADALIAQSTFFKWLLDFPDFAEVYKVAQELAYKHWDGEGRKLAITAPQAYRMIMKNRFDMTEQRKVKLAKLKPEDSLSDQYKAIVSHMQDGDLTSHEAQQMASLIVSSIKIEEHSELKGRLELAEAALRDKV